MTDQDLQKWFESIWVEREDRLYRDFFGNTGPGIYNLQESSFRTLGCSTPDPRFLTHGVLECPPSAMHADWIYVSSGMSNPWGESPQTVKPDAPSGLGYEFVMHTRAQGKWPIQLLHWLMAVQLLVAAGQVEGEHLQHHDRVPLGGPLAKKEGLLTHLLIASPADRGQNPESIPTDPAYPSTFALPSGQVEFLLVLGITAKESDFARTQSADGLITLLRHHNIFPLTIPDRPSTL
jgi:hypothetical protein